MIPLAALLLGVAYSMLVTKLWQAVHDRRPWRAGVLDLGVGLLIIGPYQLWYISGGKPLVLLGEVVGSAIGTTVAVFLDRRAKSG